jgi:iron complex transport system substrate-binding protein
MIEAAGGRDVLGVGGHPSRTLEWRDVAAAGPEAVVFMPCGYGVARARREGELLLARPELADAAEIHAVEANAYFSRPGPRIVDGVELLAAILHPDAGVAPIDGRAVQLR